MRRHVLIALFLLGFPGILLSQSEILNRIVRIENKVGTIGSILEEIERNGDFFFTFNQDIPRNKSIRLKYSRQTVQQYLDEIFNKNIYCVEYGKYLLIKLKPELPDHYSVRGKVVNSVNGEPVAGVNVIIPGSDPLIGAVSDDNGLFQINVPREMDIIQFSCIGFESRQLDTDHPIPGKIDLKPMKLEIREVVFPEYLLPVRSKSSVAISYIQGDRLEKNPGTTIENALQGNSSGVHVVENSGMPGASFQVTIRGNNSLINSDPVYYLDGIPLQKTLLNAVSPHDIASVEVLKDASSTALYGASAGNGVVLLHSRNGTKDKTKVSLHYQVGLLKGRKVLDLMGHEEYVDFSFLVIPPESRSVFSDMLSSNIENKTDHMKLLFHPAKTEDCHLSVSGGNERSRYYINSGYLSQASIIKELEFRRFSFKINSQHQISPKWHLGHDLNFAHMRHEGLNEGCFLNDHNNPVTLSLIQTPVSPQSDTINDPLLPDIMPGRLTFSVSQNTPYLDEELSKNLRKNHSLFGSLTSKVQISRQISFESLVGYELFYQKNLSYNRKIATISPSTTNPVFENYYKVLDLSYHWQNYLRYSGTIGTEHQLKASLGFELGQSENEWIPVEQSISFPTSSSVSNLSASSSSVQDLRCKVDFIHHAAVGSINYIFKERFLVNGVLRREVVGFDSTYNVRKQYTDWYPSVSLGWIFLNRKGSSYEDILHFGKIRYGFGMAGNSPRLNYSFHARLLRDMAYVYSFNSGGHFTNSANQRQANDRFYMEKVAAHNLGVELGLLGNKVFVSADLFRNHMYEGITSTYANPSDYLYRLYFGNYYGMVRLPVSEIVSSGIEGMVSYKKSGHLMKWNLSLHLTRLRNRIMNIDRDTYARLHKEDLDPITANLPGESPGSFYGYKIERLFQEEDCTAPGGMVTNQPFITDIEGNRQYAQPDAKAGDYKFVDKNNDSMIDKNDKTIIGNPFPDFVFGINANVRLRQFDLTVLWQGTYGNEIFNATRLWLYNPYGTANWSRDILNSYRSPTYTESGEIIDPGLTDTELHRFDFYAENKNLRVSDFYIEDGSYIRLKNIQLGYTFDPLLTKRIHIQELRIFIGAQNLLTFTNYSGLDPEVGGWGIDSGIYPQPRIWMAGVNVEF